MAVPGLGRLNAVARQVEVVQDLAAGDPVGAYLTMAKLTADLDVEWSGFVDRS